jgi:monodehydroascorbate reductase (NADH)
MEHYKYLIIGGGNSSGYAARQFVKLGGSAGELCIITEEDVVSYERPALSKAYLFPENPARLPGFHTCVGGGGELQGPGWYAEHGITFRLSTKVTSVDVKERSVTLESGEKITYDKLIAATGARPVTLADFNSPGADLKGVHYLRNVKDADALIEGLSLAKTKRGKALCIGGGYIGMECAAALCLNGLEVTMVFPEAWLFQRLLTSDMADFYESVYAEKGIKMIKGALCKSLEGNNEGFVTRALLDNGESVDADVVVVGIGARPNVSLFDGQLELVSGPPGGIKVNSHLQTSDKNVYAIGDVAAFPESPDSGNLMRQEHVVHCRMSAAHAMSSAMGEKVGEYEYLPFFYSRVFNLSWQFYGAATGDVTIFGKPSSGKFGAFWVNEGKIVGGFYEGGDPEDFAALKSIVSSQPDAPGDLSVGLALASRL